jgi:hypothetical protein
VVPPTVPPSWVPTASPEPTDAWASPSPPDPHRSAWRRNLLIGLGVATLLGFGLLAMVTMGGDDRPGPWSSASGVDPACGCEPEVPEAAAGPASDGDSRTPATMAMIEAATPEMVEVTDWAPDDGTCFDRLGEAVSCRRSHRGQVVASGVYGRALFESKTPVQHVEDCVYLYTASHGDQLPPDTHLVALVPDETFDETTLRCALTVEDGGEPLVGSYAD